MPEYECSFLVQLQPRKALNPMGLIFFSAFVLWIIWLLIIRPINRRRLKRRLKRAFDLKTRNCKYSLYHDRTGIALNPKERKIFLAKNDFVKEYSFDDVRKWETSWRSGGTLFNPSLAGLSFNRMQIEENKADTGISFYVKDINHARWFVKFPYHENTRDTLAQWHEILNQYINDGVLE